jgi:hypothetical protein
VTIKHGKKITHGGQLLIGVPREEPVGYSRWSVPYLQYMINAAVSRSIAERPGGADNLFADVDFTSELGRRSLPDVRTTYTTVVAEATFNNDDDASPLFPFGSTNASMLAYFRAAVAARRNAETRAGFAAAMEAKVKQKLALSRKRAIGGGVK